MLNNIIKHSLKNRLLIVVVFSLIAIYGGFITKDMEVDVFPDLTAPTVLIMTEAHGMAPEEVEKLVTFPIETSINGATGIRRVRSSSAMGFSMVWAEFNWNMDPFRARQIVTEKLATIANTFPEGVDQPVLAPQSSLMGEILLFTLTSDSLDYMKLRTLAEWNIRPRILALGGVAQVNIIGGENKEYQILLDQNKLKFFNVSLSEVRSAALSVSDNAPGGFINSYGNEYIIRGMARTNDVEKIGNSVIKLHDGYPIKINDVGEVKTGASPKIGEGSYNGQKAVVVTITKQPDINTLALTKKIKETLSGLEKESSGHFRIHDEIFEQANFINRAIQNILAAIFEGGLFVVIILFIFLLNFRTTIISLTALPISLLITILILNALEITINTMTLGGMAIAIGSLVDDAIIDVENVYKRLRENINKPKTERRKSLKVIYDASVEIRSSILNATLIIMVSLVPLFFLSGMEGRMLKPLGISYIIALFASLIVALTLTPVMTYLLLRKKKTLKKHAGGSKVENYLQKHYAGSLEKILPHSKKLVIGAGVLFILSLFIFTGFGRGFLPPFNEGSLTINISSLPGISLEKSDQTGRKAEMIMLSMPEIDKVARRTGRSELAEHSFGSNTSEIDAPYTLKDRTKAEFIKELREKLHQLKGVNIEVGQPISHRIDAMLSGTKTNIAVKLFGEDLNILYNIGKEIHEGIDHIDGVADNSLEQQIAIPQIQILPKRIMLAKYGIPVNEFSEFVETTLSGRKVSDIFEGEKAYDLVLRYNDQAKRNIGSIRDMLIDTPGGKKIPLHYVADIKSASGPNTINREDVKRKLVISVNVAGRDVRSVVKEIRSYVDNNIALPENYHIEYGGQFESEERASQIILITSLAAILIIFLLLFQEFKSIKISGIILLNLPLALIGGVLTIWLTGSVLSIPAIIGFVTLFGIATRNGILLISKYQSLKRHGHSTKKMIISGASDRLNPILMTALTAALALIPLAIRGDVPGNEIQSPMAKVILGGLLSSTLLNVYVLPAIFYLTEKNQKS